MPQLGRYYRIRATAYIFPGSDYQGRLKEGDTMRYDGEDKLSDPTTTPPHVFITHDGREIRLWPHTLQYLVEVQSPNPLARHDPNQGFA
ncbi:hypothetical protein KC614_00505 [candidate division WWE3 bacterium]|uniref:Uncharacterized protein n=1 Tax=candidate division WWE3 bacterium TaxID=2053526 RepID=A0A955LJB1_UNCKA|nr:hypothetical protein [candidate division WWE3 bacterium]